MITIEDRLAPQTVCLVRGEDMQLTRTVVDIPADQTVLQAWLTLKTNLSDSDEQSILAKTITTVVSPVHGGISNEPDHHQATVVFLVSSAETALVQVGQTYFYDIVIALPSGKALLETGFVVVRRMVRHAFS